MSMDVFFAWREDRAERDELVGSVAFPTRPTLVPGRVSDEPGGSTA